MWVTVPSGVRITEEIISEIKNNHGIILTGRCKDSGKYKKLEIAVSGNEGRYTPYSEQDLNCIKECLSISSDWKLRGRK